MENTNNRPLYIEFIGLPAVGKSTLFNQINFESNWLKKNDFIRLIKQRPQSSELDNNLFYQSLSNHKVKTISDTEYLGFDKLKVLEYFYRVIVEDYLIYKFNNDKIIIAEEGLLHNFSNNISDLYTDGFDFSNNLQYRVVIYCYSSPEKIALQILKRKEETGFILPQHKGLSYDELCNKQIEAISKIEKYVEILNSLKIPILKINTAENIQSNVYLINDYINKISQPIEYLTYSEYFDSVTKLEGGHWTLRTISPRWDYHLKTVNLVKSLNLRYANEVLEMGTMGVQCVKNSHTIDYAERWDFPDKMPTYLHDARQIPWPIKNKQYELFIALRVYQHLTPLQRECTIEAMRIAKKVLIVVPNMYNNKVLPNSKGITYSDFVNFLDGVYPNIFLPTEMGDFYYWDTENPSYINIESIIRNFDYKL